MEIFDDVTQELTKAIDQTPVSLVAESLESIAGIGKIVAPSAKSLEMISQTFGDIELFDDSLSNTFKKVSRMAENLNPLPTPPQEARLAFGQAAEKMLNPQPLPPKERFNVKAFRKEAIEHTINELSPQELPPVDAPPIPEPFPTTEAMDDFAALPGEERLIVLPGQVAADHPEDEMGRVLSSPEDELLAQAEVPPEDEMGRVLSSPEDELLAQAEVPPEDEMGHAKTQIEPELSSELARPESDFSKSQLDILKAHAPKISEVAVFQATDIQSSGRFAQSRGAELEQMTAIAAAIQQANAERQKAEAQAQQTAQKTGSVLARLAGNLKA